MTIEIDKAAFEHCVRENVRAAQRVAWAHPQRFPCSTYVACGPLLHVSYLLFHIHYSVCVA